MHRPVTSAFPYLLILLLLIASTVSGGTRPHLTEQDVKQFALWLRLDDDQKLIAESLIDRHRLKFDEELLP